MPIITIEVVGSDADGRELALAQLLADAIARALHSAPGQTWVRVRWLRRELYAENERSLDIEELPVFVTVLKRSPPAGPCLDSEVSALTETIARVVGRAPQCVIIEYAPSAAGRVAFGGTLVQ
jgi:phenylpyruvate tautomerase PptA (4-oxalocrotonate tautomerase family)